MASDSGKKPWTDAEKLGVIFQIIEKAGPIRYDELELPEGRTKKAVTVMIDKEKAKVRAAAAAKASGSEPGTPSGKTPTKRKGVGESTPAKKQKTTRKKMVKAGEESEAEEETPAAKDGIKAEPETEAEDAGASDASS